MIFRSQPALHDGSDGNIWCTWCDPSHGCSILNPTCIILDGLGLVISLRLAWENSRCVFAPSRAAQAEFGSFWRRIPSVVSSKGSERRVERCRNPLPARTHLLSLSRQNATPVQANTTASIVTGFDHHGWCEVWPLSVSGQLALIVYCLLFSASASPPSGASPWQRQRARWPSAPLAGPGSSSACGRVRPSAVSLFSLQGRTTTGIFTVSNRNSGLPSSLWYARRRSHTRHQK